MKNTSLILVLLIAVCTVVSSCHKDPEPQYAFVPKDPAAYNNLKKIEDFIKKNEVKYQVFSVDATKNAVITSKNGVKYYVPAYTFETISGMPVTGNITISVKEILNPSEMILSNKPTLASGDRILESFGEFFVKAQQGGQNLRFRLDSGQISNYIRIALKNRTGEKLDIPLWEGDTTLTLTQNGHNHENQPITKTTNIPIDRGVDWKEVFGKNADTETDTIRFNLPKLFSWVNCDKLYSIPGAKTTVLCYFENYFNNEPIFGNKSGASVNMCYFKIKGVTSLIKMFSTIMDAPSGKEGFVSPQNVMPVGHEGTFLAICIKNERFYCEAKTVTIEAPAAGKNYFPIAFQLKEVTEAELVNIIKSLDQ